MEKKQRIIDVASRLTEPFKHIVVGQVDDYCAYLTRIEGTYLFHQHARDEMYLVMEGHPGSGGEPGRAGRGETPFPLGAGGAGADVQGARDVCGIEHGCAGFADQIR